MWSHSSQWSTIGSNWTESASIQIAGTNSTVGKGKLSNEVLSFFPSPKLFHCVMILNLSRNWCTNEMNNFLSDQTLEPKSFYFCGGTTWLICNILFMQEKFKGVDIRVRVSGGGHVAQIYAIRQAISKALVSFYQKCEYIEWYSTVKYWTFLPDCLRSNFEMMLPWLIERITNLSDVLPTDYANWLISRVTLSLQ